MERLAVDLTVMRAARAMKDYLWDRASAADNTGWTAVVTALHALVRE